MPRFFSFEEEFVPNFFSAFTNDVFRPLATLLIPGAIGISTWFIALILHFPALRDLATRNHAESGFLLLFAAIFAGMVFEDFGARYEVLLDKWADERTDGGHSKNWNKYLQTAFEADPIGRRYARAKVLQLKFELGTAFGMVCCGLGLVWLVSLGLSACTALLLGLFCSAFVAWGLIEAKETHKVLSKTRAALLGEIRIVGGGVEGHRG
jgi:hypothetical protein